MKPYIAVATAYGRIYYQLVSELKRRKIPFIVVKPSEAIPLNIEVAITTASEKSSVCCPNILTYDEKVNPSIVIDNALQIVRGKPRYDKLVVGIDPGKDFGVAVIGDGVVLYTKNVSSEEGTAYEARNRIEQYKARKKVIKIGNGAKKYQTKLIRILDKELPPEVSIESVEERDTTKNIHMLPHRSSKDTSSAIKIALRRGRRLARMK